jgi:hypothetical protein
LDRLEKNAEFAKELNITPVSDKIQDYRINWKRHINRMTLNKIPWLIKIADLTTDGTGRYH